VFGNVTTISFRAVRVDLAPPAATFQFKLPPGVELIELTPTQ
jgi:outer membrane lipoprotein-sorting protein